jgi:hypothetical protein
MVRSRAAISSSALRISLESEASIMVVQSRWLRKVRKAASNTA